MPEVEILFENTLRATIISLEQSFSQGHYYLMYQHPGKGFIYVIYITLGLISEMHIFPYLANGNVLGGYGGNLTCYDSFKTS